MLKLRKNKKGFTLVELIVVIAIMAVLAGTVAGVTVTQLNKQTDNAEATQAKKIADTIYTELIEKNNITMAEMQTALTEAYGADYGTISDTVGTPAKGEIDVYYTAGATDDDDDTYTVKYTGKQGSNKGDVTYTVTITGGVTKA